ncbi:MAG: TlpA disulfide reductase family protein [Dehalococcoidia bacterium]|nr:TlpA disulfide reductase family protein [Dehalococcoidia bacterium]
MKQENRKFLLISMPLILIFLSIFIFIIIWSTISTDGQHGQPGLNEFFSETNLRIDPYTKFEITTISEEIISSNNLGEEYLMIDFWASWCPPCIKEGPILSEAYKKWSERGINFVGVSLWDSEKNALSFKDRFSINYPLALDTNGEIAINFGVRALPEKFFIDNRGKILKKVIGPVNESQLNEILEELLSDK